MTLGMCPAHVKLSEARRGILGLCPGQRTRRRDRWIGHEQTHAGKAKRKKKKRKRKRGRIELRKRREGNGLRMGRVNSCPSVGEGKRKKKGRNWAEEMELR